MHAMQLSSQSFDESPSEAEPPATPPPHQHANKAFESTLLKKIEELTTGLAALKNDMGKRNTRGRQGRDPKRYC